MAGSGQKADRELMEILQCSICMNAFTDPRMLPCIHTFCFECLKSTAEANQRKPGEKMPCPLCRKDFTIPADGVTGVPKNFFMENLLQYKTTLQMGVESVVCDICMVRDDGKTGQVPGATMRCLECQDNYCDTCIKVHQFQKLSRNHKVEQILYGNEASTMTQYVTVKYCTKHPKKPLEYFCTDCKKIVCVSCFVESHSAHKCNDVTTLDKEFRQTIEKKAAKISALKNEMTSMIHNQQKRNSDFLKEIDQKEREILGGNQEPKCKINQNTQSLLNELSLIKASHLKEIENKMEEIDRRCTILNSFEVYCIELSLKGSANDICSSVDQLVVRADELERDHKAFIGRQHQSVGLSFQTTDLQKSKGSLVGNVKGSTAQLDNVAIVVGFHDGLAATNEVIKIDLCRPREISSEHIPATIRKGAFAAVYCNTMYVVGIGFKNDEIWKYSVTSGWIKCASLVQGRRRHSAAFINEFLYICGGYVDSDGSVLYSVEAYDAINDKCTAAGKLVHCVKSSDNCVPYKSSLYIFGGSYNREVHHVQVYSTRENSCSVLSTPMPRPCRLMRAVQWKTSVILLGRSNCFMFNLETETWKKRNRFKTGVEHFGLVLDNERIFVIGGGASKTDKGGKATWKCRDDVRYVPLRNIIDDEAIKWKIHATLPKPSLVYACAKVRVQV